MSMRFTQLQCKEVICVSDGRRLGFVTDVQVEIPSGNVCAIVVPCPARFPGCFGRRDDFIIPWNCIKRIGPDIVLVEAKPEMLKTRIRGWYSNRNSKDKPFDDEAFVIRFRDDSGKTVAAMQNFNCHSTVVGPQNMLITSDLQGGVRARLAEWLGGVP